MQALTVNDACREFDLIAYRDGRAKDRIVETNGEWKVAKEPPSGELSDAEALATDPPPK